MCQAAPRPQAGCTDHVEGVLTTHECASRKGAKATYLLDKAAALVIALRLETGKSASLQAMLTATVSLTADPSVESRLPDFPRVSPSQLCVAQLPEDVQDEPPVSCWLWLSRPGSAGRPPAMSGREGPARTRGDKAEQQVR